MSVIDILCRFPSLIASKLKHPLPSSPECSSQALHSLPQGTAPIRLRCHWREAGTAGNIPHAAAQTQGLSAAGLCPQGQCCPQGLPRDHTSTGVTVLADVHWSPSPSCTLPLESSMSQSISPSALIPHDRESLQTAQHAQQSLCVCSWMYLWS